MPATYTLIASNTLSSTAASVTFSAIPGTYTDLVLRYSTRNTTTGTDDNYVEIQLNSGTSGYSQTWINGTGAAAASGRYSTSSGNTFLEMWGDVDGSATSSTFGSTEIYIPNYTGTTNKVLSGYGVPERNATTFAVGIYATAMLSTLTSAITSIAIKAQSNNFASGSSFFLYGIKNS